MNSTTIPIELKDLKHRQVLNAIRLYGEISGAQLSRLTGILPSTIVYILRFLKKEGLINVSRIGNSSSVGGKPPTLWQLRAERGFIIGLEIIPKEIRTTIIDFSNKITYQEKRLSLGKISGTQIDSIIRTYINNLIENQNIPKEKIIGIGIALPGLVDSKNGIIHYSKSLGLKNLPLQSLLEANLGLPVRVLNDANAGALGIKWYPNSVNALPENIIYLTINEDFFSIGAGLIIGRKLYEGFSGTAGEIFPILLPISKLVKKAAKKYGNEIQMTKEFKDNEEILFSDLLNYSIENSRIANFVFKNIGLIVSKEIINIIAFLNPEQIIIGGDISQVKFFISDYIMPYVKRKSAKLFPIGISLPQISFSPFGIYSVSMGATALILREILNENNEKTLSSSEKELQQV